MEEKQEDNREEEQEEEQAQEQDISQLWMVPYADLMTILVIFFLALYGFAYAGRHTGFERAVAFMEKEMSGDKEAVRKLEAKEREAELAKRLQDKLAGLPKDQVALTVDSQRLKVTLGAGVMFPEGSAALRPDAQAVLAKIAESLKNLPNPVVVEGHTDNRPLRRPDREYPTNWELSAARAFNVIDFFIKQGLPASRFSALGFAANRPVGPNDTRDSRARNRRIEIYIQREG